MGTDSLKIAAAVLQVEARVAWHTRLFILSTHRALRIERRDRSTFGPAAAACSTPTAILGSAVPYDASGAIVSGLGRTMSVATAKAGPRASPRAG